MLPDNRCESSSITHPGRVIHGVIESRSAPTTSISCRPTGSRQRNWPPSRTSARSKSHRLSQATVRLDESAAPMVAGLHGEARRIVFRSSFAAWLWRQARLTFNFL